MYQLRDIVLINTRGRDPDVQPTINAEMFRASGKLGRIKSITAYGYYKVECLDDDKIRWFELKTHIVSQVSSGLQL